MATISGTSRPGYVWDETDNVWYPIGTGVHTHDYVANTLVDAKGDLLVGSAADTVARLAVGTNNHVLTADSSATNGVKWAAPAAGGKVLQVVQGTTTSGMTSTTTSYADTNLTASITPSSTTSKVLVLITQTFNMYASSTDEVMAKVKLLRGATDILSYTGDFLKLRGASGTLTLSGIFPITYLDSPETTSSTTYKTQGAVNATGASREITFNNFSSQIILMEIGA
jgi:hypothetical protein